MRSPKETSKKATRQHTRQHNSRLILKSIYDAGQVSRADLARMTGLTRATVSSIVTALMEKGLVVETGFGPSVSGKPPIMLSMAEDSHQLICIDLGNEHFTGAIVNMRGHIEQQIQIPVNGRSAESALKLVYELTDQLLTRVTSPVLGIAFGSPGLVDTDAGVVKQAVNLDWHELPLQHLIHERVDLPVYIANDSYLAALAEYSATNDNRNLVLINMVQGIGSGIVLNGRIFYGEGFGAGEIGHVSVVDDGELCRCGNHGCLETVASVRAMLQQANTVANNRPDSLLAQIRPSGTDTITWEIFQQAYQQGDPDARAIVIQAGEFLGLAVANLVGILNVERIVIAGDISQMEDLFITAVQDRMRQSVLPKLAAGATVQYSVAETNLVIIGASALILSRGLGVI